MRLRAHRGAAFLLARGFFVCVLSRTLYRYYGELDAFSKFEDIRAILDHRPTIGLDDDRYPTPPAAGEFILIFTLTFSANPALESCSPFDLPRLPLICFIQK